MITEVGTVTKIDANGFWVKTQKQSACSACGMQKGCGQKLLNRWGTVDFDLFVRQGRSNDTAIEIGDEVEIGIDENAVVKGSLVVYGIPLGLFIFVIAVMEHLGVLLNPFLWLVSLLGLYMGASLSRSLLENSNASSIYQPVLVSKRISLGQNVADPPYETVATK